MSRPHPTASLLLWVLLPVACITACSSTEATVLQGSTTNYATSSTSSSIPLETRLIDLYSPNDWRYVDYIFYFVYSIHPDTGFRERLRSRVRSSLSLLRYECTKDSEVRSFQLSDLSSALDLALQELLTEEELQQTESAIRSGDATDIAGDFGSFVFPNDESEVLFFLTWWLSQCGDRSRGPVPTAPRTTSPPSTRFVRMTCQEKYKLYGGAVLTTCESKVISCVLTAEELRIGYDGVSLVKYYTHLLTREWADGSGRFTRYDYGTQKLC